MKIIKNKIILTLLVVLTCVAMFISFMALTSFTNRVNINNLSPDTSNFIPPAQQRVNVAAAEANIGIEQIEGTDFLNAVNENINDHVRDIKEKQAAAQREQALLKQQQEQSTQAVQNKQETEQSGDNSQAEASTAPPQPQSQGANLNGYEQQVLALINNIRATHGLNPLVPTQSLTNIARARSSDMLSRDYFSHYTPEGTNIFDFLRGNGISYRNAGENLAHSMPASAGSPQVFANAWMNSPTHRDNLLRNVYTQVGIGLAENNGRRVVTTVFIN